MTLSLDPTGAIARFAGIYTYPMFRWLDRGARPVGQPVFSLQAARRAAPR